jgi:prepilin-type N-terminal cleavage/methylation domain-containing protein
MRKGFTLIEMMIVVAIIAIIAAIAIPSLLAARRATLETNAVGSCRTYANAQVMYHKNVWPLQTVNRYAQNFWNLNDQVDNTGAKIQLIDAAFAAAKVSTAPKHGYWFQDLATFSNGQNIDFVNEFALSAAPAVYARTGYRTFIVSTNGTVFAQDIQGQTAGAIGAHAPNYPIDPNAAVPAWTVAE